MKPEPPIRLLFVDDEQIMREGLTLTVDWAAYGFEVVGTAANGRLALELLEQAGADIVVTDIRMPVMDGLALTREAAARYPDMKIILLSAYDEFQYAREALRHGACEYVLKADMDCDSLLATVLRVAEGLVGERHSRDAARLLGRQLAGLRENFLLGLLVQPATPPELQFQMEALGIGLADRGLVLLHLDLAEPPGEGWLGHVLEERLGLCYPVPSSSTHRIVLCNRPDGRHALAAMAEGLRAATGARCVLWAGPFDGFDRIYAHNQALLEHYRLLRFYRVEGAFHCEGQPRFGTGPAVSQGLPALIRHLEQGRFAEAAALVEETLSACAAARAHPNEAREFAFAAIRLFSETAGGSAAGSLRQSVYQHGDFDSLREACLAAVEGAAERLAGQRYPYSRLVRSAIDYVNSHLGEELTLNRVARAVFCSPVYLSQIFKKETGRNFSEYLIEQRLARAKLLLATGSDSIRAVGEQVGIRNPSYFSKVFARYVGMQPGRYRAEHGGEG